MTISLKSRFFSFVRIIFEKTIFYHINHRTNQSFFRRHLQSKHQISNFSNSMFLQSYSNRLIIDSSFVVSWFQKQKSNQSWILNSKIFTCAKWICSCQIWLYQKNIRSILLFIMTLYQYIAMSNVLFKKSNL